MTDLDQLPPDVLTSLRRHVTAAMDDPTLYEHGTLYDTALNAYAIPRITADCPPVHECLGAVDASDYAGQCAASARLRDQPRGTTIFKQRGEWFCAAISAGNGQIGSHADSKREPALWQNTYERMVGYEIYLMRQRIRQERETAANLLAAAGFTVGQMLRGIEVDHVGYSTAIVMNLDDAGKAHLHLTKRGSRRRWTMWVGAAALARGMEGRT